MQELVSLAMSAPIASIGNMLNLLQEKNIMNNLNVCNMKPKERIEILEELILAMNGYITVLGKELDDCAVMLSVHGWQSKRVQEGIDARNKIFEITLKLKTKNYGLVKK